MDKVILKSLAPKGRLRAGINLSNFLLVPEVLNDGTPTGTSPDVAMRVATELGVECEFITFNGPGLLADASADFSSGLVSNFGRAGCTTFGGKTGALKGVLG